MTEIRVIRNSGRIGMPWQVVSGTYVPWARGTKIAGRKWRTQVVLAQFATKAQADDDLRDRLEKVK